MTVVRLATGRRDIEACLALARDFHIEHSAALMPFSEPRAFQAISQVLDKFPCFALRDASGVMHGALLTMEHSAWYSEARTLSDMMLYIRPAAREGIKPVLELLACGRVAAKQRGCHSFSIRVSTGIDTPVMDRLYRMAGMKRIGAAYRAEV